jgi:hypothetical protein
MTYRLAAASVDFNAPGALVLTYTVDGEEPHNGSMTFSTTFVSVDGDQVEQLGFKLVDRRVVAAFSFNHSATTEIMQRNYGMNPSRQGNIWTIIFPLDALGKARGGTWRADLDIEGEDRGSVLGTAATTLSED